MDPHIGVRLDLSFNEGGKDAKEDGLHWPIGSISTCLHRYVDINPVRAKMVAAPEHDSWSSYRTRVGLTQCEWLDPDPCFLALAHTQERRQETYRTFVEQCVHEHEPKFIRGAVQRKQLAGSESFVLQVEHLTGEPIQRTHCSKEKRLADRSRQGSHWLAGDDK